MNPNPSPGTRFKPGQSGNPAGAKKGARSFTALIREALTKSEIRGVTKDGQKVVKALPDGITLADLIADVILTRAVKGDFRFVKEVWDRMEGKVPDTMLAEVKNTSGEALLDALIEETEGNDEARWAVAAVLDRMGNGVASSNGDGTHE